MSIPSGLVVAWPDARASIASGWSALAEFDSKFPRGSELGGLIGALGGTPDHNHALNHQHALVSHSHTAITSSGPSALISVDTAGTPEQSQISAAHTHAIYGAATTGTTTNIAASDTQALGPPNLVVIMTEADGTADIPVGVLAWFNGTGAPENWAVADGLDGRPDMDGRYWKGADPGSDGGSTSGSSTSHSHASHTHGTSHAHGSATAGHTAVGTVSLGTGLDPLGSTSESVHSVSVASTPNVTAVGSGGAATATEAEPPFVTVLPIVCTAATRTPATGMIFGWFGEEEDIPAGYEVCDGQEGRVNLLGRFPKGDITGVQVTGGGETHTHPVPSHQHTMTHNHGAISGSISAATESANLDSGAGSTAAGGHTHTYSGTPGNNSQTVVAASGTFSPASNVPEYATIIWIEKIAEFSASRVRRRYVPHRILPYRVRPR